MKIHVDDDLNKYYHFNFEKNIKNILRKIPSEHISDINKIEVLSYLPDKRVKDAYGCYYGKREGEKLPRILLNVKNIFRGLPKPLLYIKFIPRIFLARTLLHEIAHHRQVLRPNMPRNERERDAEKYTKSMVRRYFTLDLILLKILFGPFIILQKLFKKQK